MNPRNWAFHRSAAHTSTPVDPKGGTATVARTVRARVRLSRSRLLSIKGSTCRKPSSLSAASMLLVRQVVTSIPANMCSAAADDVRCCQPSRSRRAARPWGLAAPDVIGCRRAHICRYRCHDLAHKKHRGCRETGGLPTRRALYTQKSGPRQSHSRTYGACDCRGPAFWIDRSRGVRGTPMKSSIARIHVLTRTPHL